MTGRLTGDIQRIDELLPVNWIITPNSVYTEDGGPSGRQPTCRGTVVNGQACRPGMKVILDMVQSSITVPIAPAGTFHTLPRTNWSTSACGGYSTRAGSSSDRSSRSTT